eukprot:scpid91921/ scgid9910/ 
MHSNSSHCWMHSMNSDIMHSSPSQIVVYKSTSSANCDSVTLVVDSRDFAVWSLVSFRPFLNSRSIPACRLGQIYISVALRCQIIDTANYVRDVGIPQFPNVPSSASSHHYVDCRSGI